MHSTGADDPTDDAYAEPADEKRNPVVAAAFGENQPAKDGKPNGVAK